MLQTAVANEQKNSLIFPVVIESRFGDLVIQESDMMTFPKGIYGFEEYTNYALIHFSGQILTDFRLLQCMDEIGLIFILTPLLYQNKMLVPENDLLEASEGLNIPMEACKFFAITTACETKNGLQFQLNLKAPIVLDTRIQQAFQYILERSDYPVNHIIHLNA